LPPGSGIRATTCKPGDPAANDAGGEGVGRLAGVPHPTATRPRATIITRRATAYFLNTVARVVRGSTVIR
jgi:hypothetical protein